jgi:predicted RNA-binding protein YlxR (DUF448 family)
MRAKPELLRVVRTVSGLAYDATGKQNGRGAYLCANRDCWQKALKAKRFNRALRCEMPEALKEELEALLPDE